MKWILLAVVLLLLAMLVGWISYDSSEDKATFTVEKDDIKRDTRKMWKQGSELISKTVKSRRNDKARKSDSERESVSPPNAGERN